MINVLGKDPNGDGEINIFDLFAILNKILDDSYDPFDSELVELYDCNFDGVVDIADITYLQNIIVSLD